MGITVLSVLNWIKAEFGGRNFPPTVGLRPMIRFQRDIQGWLVTAWDVEVIELAIDPTTWCGSATLQFFKGASPDMQYVKQGEPIELLDGTCVIAVGRIIRVVPGDGSPEGRTIQNKGHS